MKQKQFLAICAILLATLLWGMTFAFIKKGVSTLSATNFLLWRFGIASFILLACGFKSFIKQKRKTYFAGSWLGLFLLGTVLFQTLGLKTITASTSSFITGLSVILVPLFLSCVQKRLPELKTISASIIALMGIGLISLQGDWSISEGYFWTLLCAVCFAIYILLAGKYAKDHHPLVLSTVPCLVIFVISAILTGINGTFNVPSSGEIWGSILFCSIFASIFAFLLQLHYQKHISSTTTAIIFSCEPIFATITAIILLNEQPSSRFYWGAGLIFFAILFSELKLKTAGCVEKFS